MVTGIRTVEGHRRGAGRGRGSGQAGYNLVMLIVLVAVLSVLVAAALPAWSTAIQREKEEELIFRGLQYAEAIRVFQQRFGRPPVRLEELIEVEPRSIRRLWEDPVTGEAEWGLIFAGQQPGQPPVGQREGEDEQGRELGGGGLQGVVGGRTTSGEGQVTQGPIVGVHSLAEGESIKSFDGADSYQDWQFTVDLVSRQLHSIQPRVGTGAINPPVVDAQRGPPDLSSRWIGRPWPPELEDLMAAAEAAAQGQVPPGAPGTGPDGRPVDAVPSPPPGAPAPPAEQ